METIGFIGLGHMGLPMAINLIKAGYTVTGYDINANAREQLIQAGGKAVDTLQQMGKDKEIIITMLQTGDQVKQVFSELNPSSLYIDCSSIDVPTSREIHESAKAKSIEVVDAPVSGGVAGAVAATLTFMVGGTKEAFEKAKPILNKMGKTIIHTGAGGSGQAAKICNNMILGITMIGVAEAFVLGESLGLTPQKLHEVVSHSSGHCWVMDKYVPVADILDNVPANNNFQPGFTASMMLKDLKLSQQSATEVHIHTPMGQRATDLYQQFNNAGMGQLDFSAIITSIKNFHSE